MLLLSATILSHAEGAVPTAGVKAGDWAHYDLSQRFTGNASLVKGYADQYKLYANSMYFTLNFTAISGTNVSIAQHVYLTNGTIATYNSVVDVSLDVNQTSPQILIRQNYPPYLSGIANGTFLGVPRIYDNLIVNSGPPNNSSAVRYSWDNHTGVLLSIQALYSVDQNMTNSGTFSNTVNIVNTNLWHYIPPKKPGSTPTPAPGLQFAEIYVLAAVIGSLGVGLIAYTRRGPRKMTRSRRDK